MIRRTVLGAVCIALVLLIGVWGEIYLHTVERDLLAALQPPEAADGGAVLSAAANAVSVWRRHEKRVSAIVNHADAEVLETRFAVLRRNVENRDAAAAYRSMQACASLVRILLAGEQLAWENIL